ncbi:PAC2 family protein [Microbacterium rhizophilus]|uniref:PAC2 family protein n=1 Tax=Microbacterium rhizophilus TaxID=3138934 RepID=UPI0031E80D62
MEHEADTAGATPSGPTLGRRIIVAAFDGWNDAGEAATSAVGLLLADGGYEPVLSVDPELYFDYQYTRPTVEADSEGRRRLRWPEATLHRPLHTPDGATEFWILSGVEPARAWQAFAAEFVDAALREDITGFVTLGSMMADVPHTRPISIFAGSDNDGLRAALSLERSSYEGPVGVLSVLGDAAERAGIPSASLWASVPHYVAGHTPSPKATLALLDRLEELAAADVPRGTLAAEAATWEATIDAAAADDDEMREYIHQLEQARDTVESPEASGDAIAQAFESYLRRSDGRGGKDDRPGR